MSERLENGTQVRLSESGIEFLEQTAPGLLADMMGPGGLTFDIPPTCDAVDQWPVGTVDVCGEGDPGNCVGDQPPCSISADIQSIDIVPNDPPGDELAVEVRLNVWSPTPLKTHDGMTCDIDVDMSRGSRDHIRVQTTVTFRQDTQSNRTAIDVADLTIPDGDIEDDDIDISGGFYCWIIETFAEGTIVDEIRGQLNDQVQPMIQENLCTACDQGEPCPGLSTCDGQVCQEDSGEGCVMPLGMEGRLDLGAMMASIAPGKQADLDLHLWAGGYSYTDNNGVSLGVLTGARTPEHDECVPLREPPDMTPAPISDVFRGNTRPADGQPFHVGIGVHKKFLDLAGYAAYDSGALCLDIGPREVDMLTTTTFQLISASILDLSHDEEAPVVIAVRPQYPLTFDLSEPVVTEDPGTGEYEIDTPLLTVRSQDFAIDFYVLMDYRYVRAFRVLADLAIPVALVVNDQNQLVPVLGDLEEGFENLRVTESSLLEEDPATMATLFPTILGMAAGFIGDLGAIDLPAMEGFELVLDDGSITAVDGNTLMAIFANLSYTAPTPTPPAPLPHQAGVARVRTNAAITARHLPPAGTRIDTPAKYRAHGPAVTLALGGLAPDGSAAPLEWQYRVNGGFWSLYTDAPVVLLRRPEFLLQGVHEIEVRGRVEGQPRTVDREPVTLRFRVDTVAPRLTLPGSTTTAVSTVQAHDNLSAPEALQLRYRVGQGDWSDWVTGLEAFTLPPALRGPYAVQVRDEAGNTTTATGGAPVVGLYGRVITPPSENNCGGCRQSEPAGATGAAGASWGLCGLLLLGWIGLRRRRRAARPPRTPKTAARTAPRGPSRAGKEPGPRFRGAPVSVQGGCPIPPRPEKARFFGAHPQSPRFAPLQGKAPIRRLSLFRSYVTPERLRAPFACLLALAVATAGGARCDCGENTGNEHCPDAGPQDLICENESELPCDPSEMAPTEPVTLDATNNCEPVPVMCECPDLEALDPGDFGRFLSIDARDGLVVVSSYSDRFGDLVVSTLDGTAPVPESVDGVPEDDYEFDPEGYRGGITDRGDDVGTFTSVAIQSDQTITVGYVDEETGALRFARGSPDDWAIHEVAAPPAEGAWTYYTALQLDAADVPAIAFMVTGLPDPSTPGGFVGQLRYAIASSAAPASATDWTVGVVDQVAVPCGGYCESDQVCVADTWTCQPEDNTCAQPCADGEACVSGACVAEYAEPPWLDHPEGLGLYVHAGRLSDGAPVLAYHDRTLGLLRLAVGSASGDASDWTPVTLEGDEYTDIGLYASLVVDASDVLHVSYTDAVRDELLYLQADTTGAVLLREVVDDGFRPVGGPAEGHHVVGLDSTLFVDSGGTLHVLYQDGTTADLWHGTRNGPDDWSIEPMETGDIGYGFFIDVARDTDGSVWVAEYLYDRAADELNRLNVWPF
jgi:hypothetical protein